MKRKILLVILFLIAASLSLFFANLKVKNIRSDNIINAKEDGYFLFCTDDMDFVFYIKSDNTAVGKIKQNEKYEDIKLILSETKPFFDVYTLPENRYLFSADYAFLPKKSYYEYDENGLKTLKTRDEREKIGINITKSAEDVFSADTLELNRVTRFRDYSLFYENGFRKGEEYIAMDMDMEPDISVSETLPADLQNTEWTLELVGKVQYNTDVITSDRDNAKMTIGERNIKYGDAQSDIMIVYDGVKSINKAVSGLGAMLFIDDKLFAAENSEYSDMRLIGVYLCYEEDSSFVIMLLNYADYSWYFIDKDGFLYRMCT